MAKKVLIHTCQAQPGEDFLADIQLPLNTREVTGLLVNAYDREKGVTVSWGYDHLQPSYSVQAFLSDNQGLPAYLGRNVLEEGAGNETLTETARDNFVNALIGEYMTALINREQNAEKKGIFTPEYLGSKLLSLKDRVNAGFFATGLRPRWYVQLGVNRKTAIDGTVTYGTQEPLKLISQQKAWNPEDLKAWYSMFAKDMVYKADATTPNYRNTFFDEPANFARETYQAATVFVSISSGGREATSEVNAYTYFGNLYGYPDAQWFGYVPETFNTYSFDAYETARIVLNHYWNHITWVKSGSYWQNINWDKSNVGELSVLFNSGRDIAVRDMPIDLNMNSKSVHYDMLRLSQKEQVNSFVRLVFKNNGRAVNPFYVKTYFFYETI